MWQKNSSINIPMQKICPLCGKTYSKENNFCSKHSDLVKLVYEKDLVKICPKCHEKYTKEENFCGMHDYPVDLCYIKDLVKKCKGCGSEYPEEYNYCIRCEWDEPLVTFAEPRPHIDEIRDLKYNPNKKYNFKNHINNFTEFADLLNDKNIILLKQFNFTQPQLDNIIKNIIKTYQQNLSAFIRIYDIDFDRLYLLDKILLFSKSLVKTEYKSVKGSDFGYYGFNEIHIEDRTETAYEITTIIHELSHFLLSEIFEQIMSEILNTNKTDALEAFVCYVLHNDIFNRVIDEYCAYTVEGRFEILGYQDYGSYKSLLGEFSKKYSKVHLDVAKTIGNTLAIYIKSIIESFIDDELREEIKDEFKKLNDKKSDGVQYETNKIHGWDKFKPALRLMLTRDINQIVNNPEDMNKLENARLKFMENNARGI